MMDPMSLTLGIISIVKDTYFVGKFIYTTVQSAIQNQAEREEISGNFQHEMLLLRAFVCWFVDSGGILINDETIDKNINKDWLVHIYEQMERLKTNFAEYRRVAQEDDDQYRKQSPLLNKAKQSTNLKGFDLSLEPSKSPDSSSKSPGWFASKKVQVKASYTAGEWALFRKNKLDRIVEKFRARNQKLQEILRAVVPMQLQYNAHRDVLVTEWMGNKHLQLLGLSGPVELHGIQKGLDDAVKAPVLERSTVESNSEQEAIHSGTLKTVVAKGNVSEEAVLIEYKYYVHPKIVRKESDLETIADLTAQLSSNNRKVHNLAALLRVSGENHMGTLPLKGIIDQSQQGRHAFIFEYPSSALSADPITLHSLITITKETPLPLALRLHIAHFLTRTLASLHIDGWVHKDVRSQSLVFFSAKKANPSSSSLNLKTSASSQSAGATAAPMILIESPYLINFEYARPASGSTALFRDDNEAKDIYRHPAVQADAEKKSSFNVVHDIYSLGVVLLEIATWQTAQAMVDASKPDSRRPTSRTVRQLYVDTAEKNLPFLMGTEYTDAVLACLGDDFRDEYKKADFAATFRREVVDKVGAAGLVKNRGGEW